MSENGSDRRRKPQMLVYEVPSEVLDIIGRENLPTTDFGVMGALESLERLYRANGLQWMKDNRDFLIRGMEQIKEVE